MMEGHGITGVTANDKVVGFHLSGLELDTGGMAAFLMRLNELGLEITGLHEYSAGEGRAGLSFVAPDLPENRRRFERVEAMAAEAGGTARRDEAIGAVSVVGGGVIQAGPLAHRILATLGDAGVPARSFSSSTLSMTFLVAREDVTRAVAALHRRLVEETPGTGA